MKAVLVLNCGSSSVKFAVIDADDKSVVVSGVAERLSSPDAVVTFKQNGEKDHLTVPDADHEQVLAVIVDALEQRSPHDIVAVGHRVVHGGERFAASCLIDKTVLDGIKACCALAPLHNPANILGIEAAQKAYPTLAQVAVFDTAFHQTLPETAYLYAVPYRYYQQYGVRRYGFHGTSYRYITQALPRYNDKQAVEKVIVAHLGNGASVCAIEKGKSVATSMGLTPLEGLVQGTRSGNIDPAIVSFLADSTQKSQADITDELWKQSGLLGLSESTNDCRELEEKANAGDVGCQRALAVFVARLQEIIGSYAAVMNGVDALVFTGGIGENSSFIREKTMEKLQYLGFTLHQSANIQTVFGDDGNIADASSKPIWVIPTDEERMIAKDVLNIVGIH